MSLLHGVLVQFVQFGGIGLVGVAVGMWFRGRRDDARVRRQVVERLSEVLHPSSLPDPVVTAPAVDVRPVADDWSV